jgi:hypothetical protein
MTDPADIHAHQDLVIGQLKHPSAQITWITQQLITGQPQHDLDVGSGPSFGG